jgi:predicted transcriptional regulator
MSKVGLQWPETVKLIDHLVSLDLVECVNGREYCLTPSGIEVLRSFQRIEDLISLDLVTA